MWDSRESGRARRGVERMATSFCLSFWPRGFSGTRVGRTIDACIGQDPRNEVGFSFGDSEASVDVVLIEAWPDVRAKLLRLGQA